MTTYLSTRGGARDKSFTDVLLEGLAPDGGLYMPEVWPHLDMAGLAGKSYGEVASAICTSFIGEALGRPVFEKIVGEVYHGGAFNSPAVAPLVQIGPQTWVLELFHGPTLAFKDYALQLLGRLFDHVLEQKGQRVTIVGATSGDTGSAAIEACRHCKNVDIFILHPKDRTSEVQRRQMTTVEAPNVFNIALEGNFDDCQNALKAMFADETFRGDVNLSAVNSINWARIMAQTVYYVSASLAVPGAAFAVPTGNFGNVFAAYAARKMGADIGPLVIGSNRNDILTRFFETGAMQGRDVEPSLSPSMDIQISSNFERYLFELLDRDGPGVARLMDIFKKEGMFSLSGDYLNTARQEFTAYRCDDTQTLQVIGDTYRETGYLLDPHTAVGLYAGREAQKENKDMKLVALACAHPAKFPEAVEKATGKRPPLPAHLADLYERREKYSVIPNDLKKLQHFISANIKR